MRWRHRYRGDAHTADGRDPRRSGAGDQGALPRPAPRGVCSCRRLVPGEDREPGLRTQSPGQPAFPHRHPDNDFMASRPKPNPTTPGAGEIARRNRARCTGSDASAGLTHREVARDLRDAPGPFEMGPCSSLEEGVPQRRGAAPLESPHRAAQVRHIVGITATGDRQHPLRVTECRLGVVEATREAGVVDDLDAIEGEVRD